MSKAQTAQRGATNGQAKKNGNGQEAGPLILFRAALEKREGAFADLLPPEIPFARFKHTVITALSKDKRGELLSADRSSLMTACLDAARDGLLPDGRDGALVVYNEKVKVQGQKDRWVKAVQWMPMVGGIIKAMLVGGGVTKVIAHIVYEKDEFFIEQGMDERIHHRLYTGEDRGEIRGVYAIAKTKDSPDPYGEWMTVGDVERVRSASKAPNSPAWSDWWEEMARKSVVKRQAKYLPLTERAKAIIQRDNERFFAMDTPPAALRAPDTGADERPRGAVRLDALARQVDDDAVDAEYEESTDPADALDNLRFFATDHEGQKFEELTAKEYVENLVGFLGDCPTPEALNTVWMDSMGPESVAILKEHDQTEPAELLEKTYKGCADGFADEAKTEKKKGAA